MPELRKGCVIAAALISIFASRSYSAEKVLIIKGQDIPAFNESIKGTLEAVRKEIPDCDFTIVDLRGDPSNWAVIRDGIRKERPSLIMTVGTLASESVTRDLVDVPVIFSMVLNPQLSGIVRSFCSPGEITGASLDISLEEQFRQIRILLPSVKNIGVLYNPSETGPLIREAAAAAGKEGLTLIAEAVGSEKDMPVGLARLMPKIDLLWSVADSTVFSAPFIEHMIAESIRKKVPFMGLSPHFVKAGALFSMKTDEIDIGRQAGETAIKILTGKSRVSNLPVTRPKKVGMVVNKRIARLIGVNISKDAMGRAEAIE